MAEKGSNENAEQPALLPATHRHPGTPQPSPRRRSRPPGPAEIAATAVQAAGEIAQIGLTMWGQMLKQWMDRIPRP